MQEHEIRGVRVSSGAAFDSISILVPTRNRPEMLVRCLESLDRVATADTQIIVIDQSESHAAVEDLPLLSRARLCVLRSDSPGKSRALNTGLTVCRSDLVAAVDDDITVDEDWLARGIQLMQQRPEIDLAFGLVRAAPGQPDDVFIPEFLPHRFALVRSRRELRLPLAGMGANVFIRRRALEAVGGWDSSRGPGAQSKSGDDWDLAYRVLRSGGTVSVAPQIAATHWGARNYADGTVRNLIAGNYYGVGYGLASYVKQGDLFGLPLLGRVLAEVTVSIMWNIARWHRPIGIRRFTGLVLGGAVALATGTPSAVERLAECGRDRTEHLLERF